jgi:ABC-type lipoprotein release transport system permease subunit
MPTIFYFPWAQLLAIFGSSLICAIIATVSPTKSIVNKKIASILRMA